MYVPHYKFHLPNALVLGNVITTDYEALLVKRALTSVKASSHNIVYLSMMGQIKQYAFGNTKNA